MKNLVFILFFISSCFSFGQSPVYIHLTEKDGLPDIEFYDMLEDRNGFIWFAADKGLFRYDGKEFKSYSNASKKGLSVFELFEDEKGRIWCTNISGQFLYVENDKLHTFIDVSDNLKGSLANYKIINKALIIFGDGQIIKVSLADGSKKVISQKEKSVIGSPFSVPDGILFKDEKDIFKLDFNFEKTRVATATALFEDLTAKNAIPTKKTTIFQVGERLFFFHTISKENIFYTLSRKSNTLHKTRTPEILKSCLITRVIELNDKLWFLTSTGAHVFKMTNNELLYEQTYLSNEFVTKIVIDKDNNYWLTTLRNGVFIITNIYVENYNIQKSVSNVSTLEKIDEQTFAFGTVRGDIGLYNLYNNDIKILKSSSGSKVSSLSYNAYYHKLYISHDTDAYELDLKTGFFGSRLNGVGAKDLVIKGRDTLLIIGGGKSYFVARNDLEKRISFTYTLTKKRAYAGFYDKTLKNTYIATIDNLIQYDRKLIAHKILYNGAPILGKQITQTRDGIIWISTFKDGVFGIRGNQVIRHFSTDNDLVANEIVAITSDENNLWIATNKGIQLINRTTGAIKTLTKRDGIPSYKISGMIVFEDHIVCASNVGIFSVDKEKTFYSRPLPELYFTAIKIADTDTVYKPNYKLAHDQNSVRLDFRANSFQSSEHIVYQYKLNAEPFTSLDKGVDYLDLKNLKNGTYNLKLRAKNRYNNEVSPLQHISFVIALPFWQQWWFILLTLLSVVLIVYFYVRSIITKRKRLQLIEVKQLQQNNRLTSLKLENLRSQMNPHFIFNALNSIQEYIVLNQKDLASDYLGKFADLVRKYLNHSNKGSITLREEIDCLQMYLELEKLRFEDKLMFSITVDNSLDTHEIMIPTMLVQPYVENAIKHGLLHKKNQRELTILFQHSKTKNTIQCQVMDNGIGREKAGEIKNSRNPAHASFATKATDNRLQLINLNRVHKVGVHIKDLKDSNDNALGTEVTIEIPYKI
ncbi:histidine kinase [uncultured Dokdonia sp.]|uniref:sensor histidine kinase n=1 Tax=uncultured Dokdonia sp. TaxID=575653 RepID=UPI00261A3A0E|nr:histidine kinase [uncultured Dokdonia sp.]